MTNYAVTRYDTVAAAETAIEAIATSSTFLAVSYREGCNTKVMVIVPDPRAAA